MKRSILVRAIAVFSLLSLTILMPGATAEEDKVYFYEVLLTPENDYEVTNKTLALNYFDTVTLEWKGNWTLAGFVATPNEDVQKTTESGEIGRLSLSVTDSFGIVTVYAINAPKDNASIQVYYAFNWNGDVSLDEILNKAANGGNGTQQAETSFANASLFIMGLVVIASVRIARKKEK